MHIWGDGKQLTTASHPLSTVCKNTVDAHAVTSMKDYEKIKALAQAGDPESVIKWATILSSLLNKKQFDINPIRVRAEGTLYGTVGVDKRKIYRTIQKYSEILEKLCAPIYEELERLSKYINGFYMQNRAGDAFKASDSAKQMVAHTERLSHKEEK